MLYKIILFLSILFFALNVSAQEAMVTFRFDDGLTSQYDFALPILNKYGYSAAEYIFTNPLQEGDWDGYLNWVQVGELQNIYGWEIGSHTKSHLDLTQLSDSQILEELSGSRTILQSRGFNAESFVSPFGEYDNRVLALIAQFYSNHGSAWPLGTNFFPFDDYNILVREPANTTSVQTIKNWIDQAVANNQWLVLLFHGIVDSVPSTYEYSKDGFESVVDYVNSKNILVVTPEQALTLPDNNLISNNWLGDFILDTNNHGAMPDPGTSLRINGSAPSKEFIQVNSNQTYLLKAYFNCQNLADAKIDFFIDEYDKQGNWVGWKWETGIWNSFVGYKSVVYNPDPNVGNILIWVKAPSNNSSCYIDNINFVPIGEPSPPPPPPDDSLIVKPGDVYTQEFSEIDSSKTYTLKVDFNCLDFVSGGVDIFIDEYDSAGNWLNWEWATGIWSPYLGTKTFNYIPKPNTKKLLVWIESVPESDLTCYLDNFLLLSE